MKTKMTVGEWFKAGQPKGWFLHTHTGMREARYVRNPDTDPWLVTDGNGGFGCSWCICMSDELLAATPATPGRTE